jgi:hypothetical protein
VSDEEAVSNALALAGVTAVLRGLLNDGLITHNVSGALGSTVTVTALAPDRLTSSNGEDTQLNLFLHRVTPNQGWRNEGLPSRDGSGRVRLSNPALALDLHYLVSAYGSEDLQAEILLGYAMQLFHESPVLDRRVIAGALNPPPEISATLPPALRALSSCGLADQIEQIKITPEYLSTEEMSKLWTAAQAHYRPAAAYLASVVLIESTLPAQAPLPVLSRGPIDAGRDRGVVVEPSLLVPFPTIDSVAPRDLQPVASVGSVVDVAGHHLGGTDRSVLLSSARFLIDQQVSATLDTSDTRAEFSVPTLPVGIYQLAVRVVRPSETEPRTSNYLALVVGPVVTSALPMSVARDQTGRATITLGCRPEVRPGQRASLLLGVQEVIAESFTSATETLTFQCEAAPIGDHLVRLRVDGIDSPILDRASSPPTFLNSRITIT